MFPDCGAAFAAMFEVRGNRAGRVFAKRIFQGKLRLPEMPTMFSVRRKTIS
jgi:hypothetical protein